MRAPALLSLLLACGSGDKEDRDGPLPIDSAGPVDSGGSEGDGDGDDTAPPAALGVEGVTDLGCGSGGEDRLEATATAPGQVAVTHLGYADGCCPREVVPAVAVDGDTLRLSYTLVEDLCDCICSLDVAYTIVGVPAGDWTLMAVDGGLSTAVRVD